MEILLHSVCLALCKAGASSVCLLLTKLALIAQYYKFIQFTNILIHILT